MQKKCYNYPVEFVEDVFGESSVLADVLKKVTGAERPRALIVADVNVVQRTEGLGAKIGRYVQAHGIELADRPVVMPGGEKVKADNLQSALKVVSAILSAKLGKNDVVLALGGGTVLDVAGYAAAQTRGGVKIVRLPTTPVAMMDAAFAEFAAVDSATVKDALRVASVPSAVVIDTTFAASVLDGVWRSGIGVALRQAVVRDAALLKTVEKLLSAYVARDAQALADLVRAVCASRVKKGVTDFSAWISARLESMSGYKLPYGYAISIGILVELECAVARGFLEAADRDRVVGIMKSCGVLDGFKHSMHLLGQVESILHGLDARTLATGLSGLTLPDGLGSGREDEPDRDVYGKVLKSLMTIPPQP